MKESNTMGTFREYVLDKVKDPEEGAAYLEAALEHYGVSKDVEALLLALRTVVLAQENVEQEKLDLSH